MSWIMCGVRVQELDDCSKMQLEEAPQVELVMLEGPGVEQEEWLVTQEEEEEPCMDALCSVLGVDLPEPKRGALLELYVQTVLFCREHSYKKEQTSALLSIIKSIHEANIETPLLNIEQCLKYCKELLLCHSVRRPPFSINLFSSTEANCILEYIHSSYMRHYKLYKYIFTPQVKLDLSLTYSGMAEHGTVEVSSVPGNKYTVLVAQTCIAGSIDLFSRVNNTFLEQMMHMSEQLDHRMKEMSLQHQLDPSQPNHKAKK
uniref:Uncharacterized protein n=1 Tax=Stegastes partitus TaxID=144197 RepID=A0A3B5AKA0_9TELE